LKEPAAAGGDIPDSPSSPERSRRDLRRDTSGAWERRELPNAGDVASNRAMEVCRQLRLSLVRYQGHSPPAPVGFSPER